MKIGHFSVWSLKKWFFIGTGIICSNGSQFYCNFHLFKACAYIGWAKSCWWKLFEMKRIKRINAHHQSGFAIFYNLFVINKFDLIKALDYIILVKANFHSDERRRRRGAVSRKFQNPGVCGFCGFWKLCWTSRWTSWKPLKFADFYRMIRHFLMLWFL